MSRDRFGDLSAVVADLASITPPTVLRAESFFVARYGVLTLTYSGFTESLARLKEQLDSRVPDLPAENPGSMWPKTTVASVRDGLDLDPDDIVSLRGATEVATTCIVRSRYRVVVNSIELVELDSRSMESTTRRASFQLTGDVPADRVPGRERASVNNVLSQWRRDGLSRYIPWLTRRGHRESHYRGIHHELILAIHVGRTMPCLDVLRDEVERCLPRRYAWIEPDALHVTLRSLGPPVVA